MMNDKQTFTMMKALTDMVSEDGREILMLVTGFGEDKKAANVYASLSKKIDSKDLAKKITMMIQSASSLTKIDFALLMNEVNKEIERRGLAKKKG